MAPRLIDISVPLQNDVPPIRRVIRPTSAGWIRTVAILD
jgi:hypothetical protein